MSRRYFFVLLTLTVLVSFTPAQEPKPTVTPTPAGDGANIVAPLPRQPLTWQRVDNADQDFAVELPSNAEYLVDSEPFSLDSYGKIVCRQWYTVSSYVDGVVMMVELYTVNKPKDALDIIVTEKFGGGPQGDKQTISNNGVAGKGETVKSVDITYQRQYFPLKNAVLMAMTISKDAAHPLATRFWKSLRVGLAKKPAAPQSVPVEADPLAAVKLDWDEQAILTAKNVTQKAVLTWRPAPPYTDLARQNNLVGTVTVRALLGANGQVRKVFSLTRLPHGLTEMALAAAKRVKFFPATKDSKAVSQWVQIEYNFNLY